MQPAQPPPVTAAASSDGTLAERVQRRTIAWDRIVRLLLNALLAAAMFRAALFVVYAALAVTSPERPFYPEGANVHFAWRAEQGLPLYPAEDVYPYTQNYMGPAYYVVVGLVGRALNADIPGLFLLGRLLTAASGLALAALVYVYLARRFCPLAAAIGGLLVLGSCPMVGYGVMVRPDAFADLLGFAGFLLAGSAGGLGLWGGAVLLGLACLTKQTAGVYALAAIAALLTASPPAIRRGVLLAVAVAAIALALIIAGYAAGESRLLAGLFSQGQIGFSTRQFATMLLLLNERSPELLWFPLVGIGLWLGRRWHNLPMATLALCTLAVALATVAKKGSDLNYFFSLRAVAAIGAATLCEAVLQETIHARRAAAVVFISLVIAVPSVFVAGRASAGQIESAARRQLPSGQKRLAARAEAIRMASDPQHPILTDCDSLGVYQATDAPLLDPYLFRLRVESGKLVPATLIERIHRRYFAALILSDDPALDCPDTRVWKLPPTVVAAISNHYRFERYLGPWFIYVPR